MLPIEWYPQWWLEHPVYLWLSGFGQGRLLVPSLLHAAILALEICAFRVLWKQRGKPGQSAKRDAWVVLMLHAMIWILTLGMLDTHVTYFYAPILPALISFAVAVRALRVRKVTAEVALQRANNP